METHVHLSIALSPSSTTEIAAMHDVPYREAVGTVQWAALTTHPNISFTVSIIARFSSNPNPVHWDTIKRIFRYLKGTQDLWLSYGSKAKPLVGYTDVDGSMAEDR
ncbi:hypothetical protein EW146_g10131 [Bondarzewia mesenterica]|uniref:Reverse transcriptase Ty1/copia-type domain-containing protein n=1 Tax=Bondarzewia mesenterica TaxID=1095465 RepID=A0A4S4L0Q4_9AGAM|nr:hypothetical protein EW146_g10131 [Bondarzewia mesenterica]